MAVDVIGPMIVAALVNGNDPVNVIDAVDGSSATTRVPPEGNAPERPRGPITSTVSFPFTSATTIAGSITSTATPDD